MFVVPPGQPQAAAQVQEYATSLGPQLEYQGIISNEGEALAGLQRGTFDAVVMVPDQVEQKIRNSEQPEVRLLHREIDPAQVSYVQYFAQIYVDELNRRVLRTIAEEGQEEASTVQEDLQVAKASARAMRIAFEQGNAAEAQRQRSEMDSSMDSVALGLGASLGVLQGVEQTMGGGQSAGGESSSATALIMERMDSYKENNDGLEGTQPDQASYSAEVERSAQIEQDLEELDQQLQDFREISPAVLVSPFTSRTVNINDLELDASDFFAPGVIVLLLQHLLITFSALSIVRERNSGTMELFRVAPVSSFETLLGKYLSYMVIGVLLAAGISALVVFVLGVPMLGDWRYFAGALAALMFASLGVGFVISLLSQTTSQAVQYSMLILLFSIFFSGFFLDLRLMWDQIRYLSWAIPATYGMQMLQNIMFRALGLSLPLIGGLLAYGLVMFIISWFLLNRQMSQS